MRLLLVVAVLSLSNLAFARDNYRLNALESCAAQGLGISIFVMNDEPSFAQNEEFQRELSLLREITIERMRSTGVYEWTHLSPEEVKHVAPQAGPFMTKSAETMAEWRERADSWSFDPISEMKNVQRCSETAAS